MKRKVLCFLKQYGAVLMEEEMSENLENYEVLVETLKTLISPGTELALYTGTHVGFKDPNNRWAKYPHYPGYMSIGRVIKNGKNVSNLKIGDIVLTSLNHCSHSKVNSLDPFVVKLPTNENLEDLLFIRMATISVTSLILAEYSIGDNVAVIGLGIVGNLCSQLFKLGGTNVFAIEVDHNRINIAKRSGIEKIILGGDTFSVKERILTETNNLGVDIVVEATGVPELVNQALDLVNDFGQVIVLGSTRGYANIDIYTHIHRKGIVIKGAHESVLDSPKVTGDIGGHRKHLLRNLELIQSGKLNVSSLITHRITPEEAIEIYDLLLSKGTDILGVIIDWKN